MNIHLQQPDGPYSADIDTGVLEVEITKAFLGAKFVSEDGERLVVMMRDGGFEVHYSADFGDTGFDGGMTQFKGGHLITPKGH